MKRTICFALATLLLLSLIGCGGGEPAATEAPTTAPAPTKPAPTVEVVEGQPIEQLDDVNVYFRVTGETTDLDGLPAYPGSGYMGAKKGRYDLLTHTFQNTSAAAFITYLNALEEDGWQQYSNNIIEGTNYIMVHPTFLYEGLWNLGVIIFLTIYRDKKKFSGELVLWYLVLYGVGRFWIEALRTDQLLIPGIGFPISQLLGAVLAISGLIAIVIGHKRAKNK